MTHKLALLSGSLLLVCCTTFAQKTTTLKVAVTFPKADTANNVTIQLFLLPDTILVSSKVTGNSTADFTVNTFSKFLLKTSSVNFENIEKIISVTDKPVTASLVLKTRNTTLGDVIVVSKKPLIKQEDDKTIVDAEVLANSSTNAYEVLEKTPGAIVDQDGNVYLASTTPATILINGREMKLSSADIASLLKNLPAGSVSKIEILRNPSAKYDAASSGGMVNIILKKGVKIGTNGTVNAAYFQGVYATKTAGFNLNKGSDKINSYLNYQFTSRNNFEELKTDRLFRKDSGFIAQQSYTTYPTTNNYLNGGIDVQLNSKFSAAYDLRTSYTDGKSYAQSGINISKYPSQIVFARNVSDINSSNKTTYLGNNISTKYKIDSLGSEWISQFDYSYYGNRNKQAYQNNYFIQTRPTVTGDGINNSEKNIFLLQSDLVLKLKKSLTIEAGFKATLSSSKNSSDYTKDTGNNIKFVDTYQTNTFKYKESIVAAYLQVSKTFAGFTIKPGLRLETTNINGHQLIPNDTVFSIRRTDLFPYLFIKHNLFKMFGATLIGNAIFRKSIRRPYYEVLNPYPKMIDQTLFDVGNPNLKPQFTTNYELNVTFDNIPVIALGINQTKDIFNNVNYPGPQNITYRTWDNLGKNREFYAKLIGGIPPGKKYFFYVGALYNYNHYTGTFEGLPFDYKRGSWTFFMFQEFKATKTLTFNTQGFLRTKGLQGLYELNTFGGLFVSANKSILKKKANIILSVNDLLRTNHVEFTSNQGTTFASGSRYNDTRRIGLTFRYNFGIKPKEGNKKSFDVPADTN